MRIGFVGLGKLGLPTAVTIALKDHDVLGYDCEPSRMNKNPVVYQETGLTPDDKTFNDYLAVSTLKFGSLDEVVKHSEILFVAVQTPHHPMYEGVQRLPETRQDFDYTYLAAAVRQIADSAARQNHQCLVAIVSTVLPGTCRRKLEPLLALSKLRLAYNPSFIAMGTVMPDFLNPEFVLVGSSNEEDAELLSTFYRTITNAPIEAMSIESAELAKVAYNTFITLKIDFVNTIAEICHKLDGDCHDIVRALKKADQRLVSPAYMNPGMGDGGGCHPRDNIAMSWLARELRLSHDLFGAAIESRERHAEWLAELLIEQVERHRLPIVILGKAFKPGTNLLEGSPAILVGNLLAEKGHLCLYADENVGGESVAPEDEVLKKPAVFLIGCRHQRYEDLTFPGGSVVVDPHGYIQRSKRYTVIQIGRKPRTQEANHASRT